MLYREAGQYKSTYAADMAVFPLRQDRIGIAVILALALIVIPLTGSDFFIASVIGDHLRHHAASLVES